MVERVGRQRGNPSAFDIAVTTAFDAVSCGWALDEPVAQLRAWLEEAAGWVDEALDRGRELDGGLARWYLGTATLARAWPTASRVAAMVPDQVTASEGRSRLSGDFLAALAALVAGDLVAAEAAAEAMRAAQADPTVPPHAIDFHAHLDELVSATAARDAGALTTAIEHRSAWLAKQHGVSIEERRDHHALLDLGASAVAACALAAGVRPVADTDYVALDLVEPD